MKQAFDLKRITGITKCWTKQGGWFFLVVAFAIAPAIYAQEAQGASGTQPKTGQSAKSEQFRFDIPPQSLDVDIVLHLRDI